MPSERLEALLSLDLDELGRAGRLKADELVIAGIIRPVGGRGPRYRLEGMGDRPFLRMNSNSYLGLSLAGEVIAAEEAAAASLGVGPGAVRFISGTWAPHVDLERRLAAFHGRPAAMLFSSAYGAVMGTLVPLISAETAVISDELNHNCIINAIRLARPREKHVYPHLDMAMLEARLKQASGACRRAVVVTDGIFSMRGDHAPLQEIVSLCRHYDEAFPENVIVAIDDSHGVGAFGATGRGTEEYTESLPADILVATLGKAFGVNGGYVAASRTIIGYLRQTSPFYIYSNPITQAEAAAAARSLGVVDSPRGEDLLRHLKTMTARFQAGLHDLELEFIEGEHPIVPLMVRDTVKTSALVDHLRDQGILATGLNYPVVPKGEEEIRFQISADHTAVDIDEALAALAAAVRQGALNRLPK